MLRTAEHYVAAGAASSSGGAQVASQGLDWLWRHLRDVRNPHILDCGPISPSTLEVLLRREAKFYAGDLATPLLQGDARFWDRTGKTPVFLAGVFLDQLPPIPAASLTAILSWNLLDLAPHDSLQPISDRLFSLLQPLGVLFCVLHEPQHKTGVESRWWLEAPASPRSKADNKRLFPYPAVTNREIERLLPTASIKTFLTRSGRREILAMRRP